MPGPFILNKDLNAIFFLAPPDRDFPVSFKRRINSVMHKIDQGLFNLRRVGTNHCFWTWHNLHLEPWFQVHHPLHQLARSTCCF